MSFLCPPARSFVTTMLGLATFSIRFTCDCSLMRSMITTNRYLSGKKNVAKWNNKKWSATVSWPQGLDLARFLRWAWLAGNVYWQPGRDQRSLVEDCISSDQTSPGEGRKDDIRVEKLEVGSEKKMQKQRWRCKECDWKSPQVPWTECSAQAEEWPRCWKEQSDARSGPARCPVQTGAVAPCRPYPEPP